MIARLLFVTTDFDKIYNGPGVYSQNLWSFFSEDTDIEFHLVAMQSELQHPRLHTLDAQPSGFGSATYAAISELAENVLNRLGSETLIHANMAHLLTPKLAKQYRSIVQVNDTEVCNWKPSLRSFRRYGLRRNAALAWRKKRERRVVRAANKTICNSNDTTSSVCSSYQMPTDRVSTIYKAIDLEPFRQAANTTSIQRNHHEIAFVGSNWQVKGLDTLLKALALLKDESPQIHLSVYGLPTTATQNQYERLTAKLGVSDLVSFVGHLSRQDLPRVLATSDVLAMPSYQEALGLAAIEALAVGIPVVGSRVGGIPEVVTEDSCGKLVPPGDPAALASAIKAVISTSNDASARKSRQLSVARFGLPRLEKELRQLYAEVSQ